jgi:drug/metabolite transporter (DMT)-like permease
LNSQDFFTNRKIVVSLAVLCCLLWGSAFPAIKNGYALFEIAAHDIPGKLVFAGVRFFISGLLLLLIAAAMNKPLGGLSVKNLGELGLLGLTQTALQYAFFYIGLAYTTGVKGSILNATSTFFSVLLAHVIYRNDRLSTGRTLGCLIGFAGVVIINFSKDLRDFDFTLLGDGSIVMTSFIFSAASIYGKRLSQKMDSIVMTGYQLSIGGLALTVITIESIFWESRLP